jgi:hypothetical protein
MKSLVFSSDAGTELTACLLSFQEQDELMEALHNSFEFISRSSQQKSQRLALKIDSIRAVFDLEVCPTTIFIARIRVLDNHC